MTFDISALGQSLGISLGTLTLQSVLSAVVCLLVCLVAIRILRAIVDRVLDKTPLDPKIEEYIAKGIKWLLYVLMVIIVADSLGIPVTSLVALISVFGLAISLAVQDVLSNVAGGMVIIFSRPFETGDYVSTGDSEGNVAEISLTHTKLDTFDGQRIMLPNSKLVGGKIINYTTLGVRRINHTVNVSYSNTAEEVRRACLQTVERTPGALTDPAPVVVVTKYGESSVEYSLRFWAKTDDYWPAYLFSLEELRNCFNEAGVTMTYNHLNVHIVERN